MNRETISQLLRLFIAPMAVGFVEVTRLNDATLNRVLMLLEKGEIDKAAQLYEATTSVGLEKAQRAMKRLWINQLAQTVPHMEG